MNKCFSHFGECNFLKSTKCKDDDDDDTEILSSPDNHAKAWCSMRVAEQKQIFPRRERKKSVAANYRRQIACALCKWSHLLARLESYVLFNSKPSWIMNSFVRSLQTVGLQLYCFGEIRCAIECTASSSSSPWHKTINALFSLRKAKGNCCTRIINYNKRANIQSKQISCSFFSFSLPPMSVRG